MYHTIPHNIPIPFYLPDSARFSNTKHFFIEPEFNTISHKNCCDDAS